jgi:hypothetical protein
MLSVRLWKWLAALVRGMALVSHAIMSPRDAPKSPQSQSLADTHARRREPRGARRQARGVSELGR